MFLNKQELMNEILYPYPNGASKPLVDGMQDAGMQIQANGIDLTVKRIQSYDLLTPWLTVEKDYCNPPQMQDVDADKALSTDTYKIYHLKPGPYLVILNETFAIRPDMVGLVAPRSTLARYGAGIHSGWWDSGYEGGGQLLLTVYHPSGLYIEQNTRIAQIMFARTNGELDKSDTYNGSYQGVFFN